MGLHYEWKRFWYPADVDISLNRHGFLPDPSQQWSKYVNPDLVTLEDLHEQPCVVLLGDTGLGKSEVARSHVATISDRSIDSLELFDLGGYGSDFAVIRNLFESDRLPLQPAEVHSFFQQEDTSQHVRNRRLQITISIVSIVLPLIIPGNLTMANRIGLAASLSLTVLVAFELFQNQKSWWVGNSGVSSMALDNPPDFISLDSERFWETRGQAERPHFRLSHDFPKFL